MAYSNGYAHRKAITVDYTKVASAADLTDYQLHINSTITAIKTVANGGYVINNSNYLDIRFELADGTKLSHEIVDYSPTTGALIAYVKIPTLSYTANTTIYMYFGKSLSSQEWDMEGTWSGYAYVNHLQPGTKYGAAYTTLNGIEYGFKTGAVDFVANQFGGASNPGEIDISADPSFTKYDGTYISGGTVNSGIACVGATNQTAYIMYSATSVHTRFSGMHASNATNYAVIRYSGGNWQYDNNTTWTNFTPVSTDVIVGKVFFTASENVAWAENLEGGNSWDSTGNATDVSSLDNGTDTTVPWASGYRRAFRGGVNSYVRVTGNSTNFPSNAMGCSFWLRTSDTEAGVYSYATSGNDNAILIYWDATNFTIYFGGYSASFAYSGHRNGAYHFIRVAVDHTTGDWGVRMDKTTIGSGTAVFGSASVATGGIAYHAQEQDSLDGGLSATQALAGDIIGFRLHPNNIFLSNAFTDTVYNNESSPSTFYSIGTTSTGVVGNDATHSHAADNLVLDQTYIIGTQDALHGHTTDNLDLVQKLAIIIQNALHGHTVDSVTLNQLFTLAIEDTVHAHAAEMLELEQRYIIGAHDALHGHTADNISLLQDFHIAVNDATHAHTVDNLLTSQVHYLLLADTLHSQTAEDLELLQKRFIWAEKAIHAQTADTLDFFQRHYLAVQDTTHAQLAESLLFLQRHYISVNDARHGQAVDNLTLIQDFKMSIDDTRHRQVADKIAKIFNWDELGKFFGVYKKDFAKGGDLTAEEIAAAVILKKDFTGSGNLNNINKEDPVLLKQKFVDKGLL
jgi:hypothetical protein